MRTLVFLPLLAMACTPSNGLSGPQSFPVQNSGAGVDLDGGAPWDAHVYIWGGVDGGAQLATVCNEVGPAGPVSSAIVTNLAVLNLQSPGTGLSTGDYLVGADGGASASVVVALGADGNQPDQVWVGNGGKVTLSTLQNDFLSGSFHVLLQPIAGPSDAGELDGTFAASSCTP